MWKLYLPPLKKITPSKSWGSVKLPPFENLVRGSISFLSARHPIQQRGKCLREMSAGKHNGRTNSKIRYMENSVGMFTFLVLILIYLNRAYLVQKVTIVQSEIYLDYFKYVKFNGGVHCICFRLEIPFLGKSDPKNKWWCSLYCSWTKTTFL